MDSVVVLADGAKVAFTATLRGAEADIVPGDTVKRRLVGYLGHDGKTGCGAKFTDIRVVCQNTLAAAMSDSGARSSITHKNGANQQFDALIQSIDIARQDFNVQCELLREFTRFSLPTECVDDYFEMVYDVKEGADFQQHWSFEPVQKETIKPHRSDNWSRNPIDYYIYNRLRSEGLGPTVQAD